MSKAPRVSLPSNLVARSGAAEKPTDQTAIPTPAPAEPKTKSLTLRLSDSQYDRLRSYAFNRKESHQTVMERALMDLLDREEA